MIQSKFSFQGRGRDPSSSYKSQPITPIDSVKIFAYKIYGDSLRIGLFVAASLRPIQLKAGYIIKGILDKRLNRDKILQGIPLRACYSARKLRERG